MSASPSSSFLSNNVQIPLIGLGTTHSSGWYHDTVVDCLAGLNEGAAYRMVDTARRYGVEHLLGQAIQDSKIDRSSLFLCTKLWPVDCGQEVRAAARQSCRKLRTDYLDLYLIHMPQLPDWISEQRRCREETWREMELLYEADVVRSIGVSNYTQNDIEEIEEYAAIMPHVNQIEYHPWYHDKALKNYCDENDIFSMAYCPLAKGRYLEDEKLCQIARKHGKTAAQICLRWSVQQNVAVVPKSTNRARCAENLRIFDFELDADDMRTLSAMLRPDAAAKCVDLSDVRQKMRLPDGYKLKGRVFGIQLEETTTRCGIGGNAACMPQNAIF